MGKGGRKGGANLSGAEQPGWCSALVNKRQATQRKEQKLVRGWRGGNIRAASASSVVTSTTHTVMTDETGRVFEESFSINLFIT